MDTDSDYEDTENDDSLLIRLIMNDKKDTISSEDVDFLQKRMNSSPELTNLDIIPPHHNYVDEFSRDEFYHPIGELESVDIDVSSDEENGREIIHEIELIAPTAASEGSANDYTRFNNVIVDCIQDENVRNELFRLNKQLENNAINCRTTAAEAKTIIAEKLALMRECRKIEDRIEKYSVEEAKVKKIKKRKGKDCAQTGHNKKTYFCRFGMPYFKSAQRFPAEQNSDYREILKSHQVMLFKLPKIRRFLRKDANDLEVLVLQQLKNKRIEQLKGYLKDLRKEADKDTSGKSNEIFERKKKICDAIAETSNVSNLKDAIDWNFDIDFMALIKDNNYRYTGEDYERIWKLLANPKFPREDFSTNESSKLKMLVEKYGAQDWDRIAELLGTNRSGFMCFTKYVSMAKKGKNIPWSLEEDELLRNLCGQLQYIKKPGSRYHWWRNIRRHFPNRTYTQIHAHWSYVLAPKLKKGRFSDEEHQAVEELVNSGKSFSEIAKIFRNRTCVQIRSHYESRIGSRNLKSGVWTKTEENKLLQLVKEYGEKNWVAVSQHMETRTRTQCRLKYLQFKKNPPEPIQPESNKNQFRKGRWTHEENELFLKLIDKHGRKWVEISKEMKTRSRLQCSFKYNNEIKFRKEAD